MSAVSAFTVPLPRCLHERPLQPDTQNLLIVFDLNRHPIILLSPQREAHLVVYRPGYIGV